MPVDRPASARHLLPIPTDALMKPFELQPYEEPNWFQQKVGWDPPYNALVELENALAAAASPFELTPDLLVAIGQERKVNLTKRFASERGRLYERFLYHRLADELLGADDAQALAHLAAVLALDAAAVRLAHELAYDTAVQRSLDDARFEQVERAVLHAFETHLDLHPAYAAQQREAYAGEALADEVVRMLADQEIDPAETVRIEELTRHLGVAVPDSLLPSIQHAAYRWTILHGPLPELPVPADLYPTAGEVLHMVTDAEWNLVVGGHFRYQNRETGALRSIHGTAYVTNRRLCLQEPGELIRVVALAGRGLQFVPRRLAPAAFPLAICPRADVVLALRVKEESDLFRALVERVSRPPP